MTEFEQDVERGLHPETLRQVSRLSQQSQETGLKFKVTAKAVGPLTDEIKVVYPNGKVGRDYIEENSKRSEEF